MFDVIRKLVRVSRPVSWFNTAFPFAATYVVLGGALDLLFFIGTLFFLIPYNLLMYGVNDVYDYDSDIRNPRKGSIEGAAEARSFHPTILNASTWLALPFLVLMIALSSAEASLILLLVMFFVVAYSYKGFRFKEIPVLDSITSSFHFVGPMVYAIAVLGFQAEAWPYALALFLWGIASHAFGAVQDIIPDRKGNLKSIATIFGARITVWFSALLYSAAAAIVLARGGLAMIVGLAGILYLANVMQYLHITDKNSATANHGWRRFILLNYVVGAIVTITLLLSVL